MPHDDTLAVHLENIVSEGGAFSLTRDGKTWTATGTRKGGRKELTASGDAPLAAVAGLLSQIRGEPEEAEPIKAGGPVEGPAETPVVTAGTEKPAPDKG